SGWVLRAAGNEMANRRRVAEGGDGCPVARRGAASVLARSKPPMITAILPRPDMLTFMCTPSACENCESGSRCMYARKAASVKRAQETHTAFADRLTSITESERSGPYGLVFHTVLSRGAPMRRSALALSAALAFIASAALAQEKEDRTLLTWDQMRAIIMEASGERAMHHVLEFVPYQRVRPASEYTTGPFRESRMAAEFGKEYGFSTVEIENFPSAPLWQPSKGQLWATEKLGPRKLYDIYDTPVALGGNTPTGDVSGE